MIINMRIYVNGVFDLCHIGHIKLSALSGLEQASLYGDVIIGIHSDQDVASYKRLPVQTMEERVEAVKNMKYVSEVIESAPLITTMDFMKEHNLDLIMIISDYDSEHDIYYAEPRRENRLIVVPRYPHMSTSELIHRIKLRNDL